MNAKIRVIAALATAGLLSPGVPALAQVPSMSGIVRDVASLSLPEGGAAWTYLLLAAAACFGAMLFGWRRRMGKPADMHDQPLPKEM